VLFKYIYLPEAVTQFKISQCRCGSKLNEIGKKEKTFIIGLLRGRMLDGWQLLAFGHQFGKDFAGNPQTKDSGRRACWVEHGFPAWTEGPSVFLFR